MDNDRKEAWSHCSRGCAAGGAAAKVNQKQEQVRGPRRDLDDCGGGKMQELCLEDSSQEMGTKKSEENLTPEWEALSGSRSCGDQLWKTLDQRTCQ